VYIKNPKEITYFTGYQNENFFGYYEYYYVNVTIYPLAGVCKRDQNDIPFSTSTTHAVYIRKK